MSRVLPTHGGRLRQVRSLKGRRVVCDKKGTPLTQKEVHAGFGRFNDADLVEAGCQACLTSGYSGTTLRATLMGWLGTQRDRRNKIAQIRWSVAFSVSLVASTVLLRAGVAGSAPLKWAIAVLPIALWVCWLSAYMRFLREADELVRRIHLEAIVVGFWTGTGFGIGYPLLEHAGLRALNPSMTIAIMVAVMLLGYAVGRFRAGKRYR